MNHTSSSYRAGGSAIAPDAIDAVERRLLDRTDGPHDGLLVAGALRHEVRVPRATPFFEVGRAHLLGGTNVFVMWACVCAFVQVIARGVRLACELHFDERAVDSCCESVLPWFFRLTRTPFRLDLESFDTASFRTQRKCPSLGCRNLRVLSFHSDTHVERVGWVVGHGTDDPGIKHLERGSSRAGALEHQLNHSDDLLLRAHVEILPPFHVRAFEPLQMAGFPNECLSWS